jgi:hypothetical protein
MVSFFCHAILLAIVICHASRRLAWSDSRGAGQGLPIYTTPWLKQWVAKGFRQRACVLF